ncbi:MAG: polysaccharide biosynthesis C-terminal domain-containing protein [Gaiellaceae bacterium]
MALVSLSLATLVVARTNGPVGVGIYALVRVLPGLIGVLISAGLPGAVTYFLAGPDRKNRHLPLTVVAMTLVGGAAGTALWMAGAPLLAGRVFPRLSLGLVLLAGVTVLTQLIVATAKSCSQGTDDLPGANRVIVNEEFMFLPAYGALWFVGFHGYAASITGLLLADVATSVLAWNRLGRRGFFRQAAPPSTELGRRIAGYGLRAQVGGMVTLLNLRLDFILLNVLAGPAVLGVYAIASKFAELLKIPALALTYVLYPRYARDGHAVARAKARRLLPRAGLLTAGSIVPLWFAATYLIPALYGPDFRGGIAPAHIILFGLALEGIAAVITAFLYGIGRPGLNSFGMAAGLLVTVVLDLLLIPRYGATGAAIASAAAYATGTVALVWFFWWVAPNRALVWRRSLSRADA